MQIVSIPSIAGSVSGLREIFVEYGNLAFERLNPLDSGERVGTTLAKANVEMTIPTSQSPR